MHHILLGKNTIAEYNGEGGPVGEKSLVRGGEWEEIEKICAIFKQKKHREAARKFRTPGAGTGGLTVWEVGNLEPLGAETGT